MRFSWRVSRDYFSQSLYEAGERHAPEDFLDCQTKKIEIKVLSGSGQEDVFEGSEQDLWERMLHAYLWQRCTHNVHKDRQLEAVCLPGSLVDCLDLPCLKSQKAAIFAVEVF